MTYDDWFGNAEGRTVYRPPPPPTEEQQRAYVANFNTAKLMAKNENAYQEQKIAHRKEVKKLLAEIETLKATIKQLQDRPDIFGEPPVVAEAVTDAPADGGD
jgi:hypothetical protein